MISFGSIKMGEALQRIQDGNNSLKPGEIGVADYLEHVKSANEKVPNKDEIISSIEEELNNIAGTINRTIGLIESDQQIQYCISGRDLSQINGKGKQNNSTEARFPNLLNQTKMMIAISALRKAQDNYNAKYNEYIAKAMKEAEVDMANLMCNKLPMGEKAQGLSASELNSNLNKPGALVLEFGGISNFALAAGGTKSTQKIGGAKMETASGEAATDKRLNGGATSTVMGTVAGMSGEFVKMGGKIASAVTFNPTTAIVDGTVKAISVLASDKYKSAFDGGTKEMWSIFNRETRVCHVCTSITQQDCKNTGSRGFLGLWDSRGVECTSKAPVENCEDIQM